MAATVPDTHHAVAGVSTQDLEVGESFAEDFTETRPINMPEMHRTPYLREQCIKKSGKNGLESEDWHLTVVIQCLFFLDVLLFLLLELLCSSKIGELLCSSKVGELLCSSKVGEQYVADNVLENE